MTDTFEISVEVRSITRCSRCRSAALGPMSFLLQSPRSQNINMIIICRQQNQFNTRSVFKPCYFVAILLVPALLAPGTAGRPGPATENPIGAADNLLKIFLISFVTKWIMAFNEIHIWLRPPPASSQLQFLWLELLFNNSQPVQCLRSLLLSLWKPQMTDIGIFC